jgi:type I restriction enzyme M protein
MNDKISQDTINKALWAACDTFRGTISADTIKTLSLPCCSKYISDVWQDHYDE